MNQSALILIKNKYMQLSDAEKKMADYIFENTSVVPELTIAEFANAAGVAASGVVRFCKGIGLTGFPQLKQNLLKYTSDSSPVTVLPAIDSKDNLQQVFGKVFSSGVRTLEDTLSMLDMEMVEAAVKMMTDAKSIHFFGVGTSATIAQDAYYRFMRIGYPAYCEVDSHIMQIAASQLTDKDVAVAVTHCGSTIDTVETLRVAKEHGAKTLAITSNRDTPICRYADISIVVYSDEINYPIEAVSARIAHIAVLDALCVALSLLSPERTAKCMEQMNELFSQKRIKN